jgi:polyhydroxyalkanoate synthesis regulator phasin
MPATTVTKIKTESLVKAYRVIKADSSGEIPTKIMLVQVGDWPDSVKGNLTITAADLHQMKMNFDSGIARPGQGLGLPIDFSHNEWQQAAGWINELEVDGDTLYSVNTEWSDAGRDAILGKMFKCISPSFYPAGRGGWQDPEDLSVSVDNVLVGAGLTNIPFFKGLSAVKASVLSETDTGDRIIYINKSVNAKEEKPVMVLEDIRVKEQADLTSEEEKFLADNKAQLTADEKAKFGIKDEAVVTASTISAEDAKIIADYKAGKIKPVAEGASIVEASRIASLEATAVKYETEKAETIVADHIKRGAIKADQAGRWTSRLLASTGEARTELESDLAALPTNEMLGQELGNGADVKTNADARVEIAEMAGKLVADAKTAGKELSYSEAQAQVLASNPDLAARDRAQNHIA